MHQDDLPFLESLVSIASGGAASLDSGRLRSSAAQFFDGLGHLKDGAREELSALIQARLVRSGGAAGGPQRVEVLVTSDDSTRLARIEVMLAQVLDYHRQEKEAMQTVQDVLAQLTADVAAGRTVMNSCITFIHGVPDLIAAAIRDTQANVPSLSEGDLAAFTQLHSDLTDQTAEITAALTANTSTPATPPAPADQPPAVVVPPAGE